MTLLCVFSGQIAKTLNYRIMCAVKPIMIIETKVFGDDARGGQFHSEHGFLSNDVPA